MVVHGAVDLDYRSGSWAIEIGHESANGVLLPEAEVAALYAEKAP
jgi:hypothetical protein